MLELRDTTKPEPKDDEPLVKIRAAGVNPGVSHLMTDLPYIVRRMGLGLTRPRWRVRDADFSGPEQGRVVQYP